MSTIRTNYIQDLAQTVNLDVTQIASVPALELIEADVQSLKQFDQDLSNLTDAIKGAAKVGFMGRTVYDRLRERISINDFKIAGQTNWNTAFANAATYIKNFPGQPPELLFNSEVYEYSISPNWACQYAKLTGTGGTKFRYSGTGNCFIIDASGAAFAAMNGVFGMEVSGIIIEGESTSQNGWYLNSTHHCNFSLRTDGCGSAYAGIDVNFAVCTKFHRPVVSVNHAGVWYNGNKPAIGMRLSQRNLGEQVAYSIIDNPIMEGLPIGMQGTTNGMLGVLVIGGTLEACSNVGLSLANGCRRCVFWHTDFEVNTSADIFNSGSQNSFLNIDSDGIVIMNAGEYSRIVGGTFHSVTVSAGATGTVIDGIIYNRDNTGGVYTDNGVKTTMLKSKDGFEPHIHDAPPATNGVPVTAPQTVYQNTTGNAQHIYVVGGTLTQITRKRGSGAAQNVGYTRGETYVAPGDIITFNVTDSTGMTIYTMTA